MIRRLSLAAALAAVALSIAVAAAQAAGSTCTKGFRCRTVWVPLDRTGVVPGKVPIRVAEQRGSGPALLVLGGGPGQGMVSTAGSIGVLMHEVTNRRIVLVDQRGTGLSALRCGRLQRADLSDLTVPPHGAVGACGTHLGDRRGLYTTTATVDDLEAVRAALDLDRWGLLGVSYGTYVAQRYARAHPDRVTHLVLDSVLPQEGVDPYFVDNLRRSALILHQLCVRGSTCAQYTRTPVQDLARLVRRTNRRGLHGQGVIIDGPALFDLITSMSSFIPSAFPQFPVAVKLALQGDPQPLLKLAAEVRATNASGAQQLSLGLHTATLCSDITFPWGGPGATPSQRATALRAPAQPLTQNLGPFDRDTAMNNGAMLTCLRWPTTPNVAPAPAPGPLPAVPTLVLSGTWDLSTPLEGARAAARRSPTAQLAVLPQVGHSTITSAPCAQKIVHRFFAGRRLGTPCAGHRAPVKLAT